MSGIGPGSRVIFPPASLIASPVLYTSSVAIAICEHKETVYKETHGSKHFNEKIHMKTQPYLYIRKQKAKLKEWILLSRFQWKILGTSAYLSISISFIIFRDSIVVSQLQDSTFFLWTISQYCYCFLPKREENFIQSHANASNKPWEQFLGQQSKQVEPTGKNGLNLKRHMYFKRNINLKAYAS